jgi:uncharacterized protein YraI
VEAAEEQQLVNRFLDVRQALDRNDLAQAESALINLLALRPDYAGGQAAELAYRLLVQRGEQARTAGDEGAATLAFQQALALMVPDPTQAQMALRQLQPTATPAPIIETAPTPFVEVQSDSLNVRLGPGTDFPIAGQLSAGSRLALVGRNDAGDWLVVCCVDGKPGWVATRLVSTTAEVLSLPVGLPPTRAPTLPPPTATPALATTATPTPQPVNAAQPTNTAPPELTEPPPAPTEPPPAPTEPPPTPTTPPR